MHEAERARAIARTAMRMFDDQQNMDALITFGRRHPLSQRFLRRDRPLRSLLEQFVQGADLTTDAELEPLREWVGALRLIRIVERETEATGPHASYLTLTNLTIIRFEHPQEYQFDLSSLAL